MGKRVFAEMRGNLYSCWPTLSRLTGSIDLRGLVDPGWTILDELDATGINRFDSFWNRPQESNREAHCFVLMGLDRHP